MKAEIIEPKPEFRLILVRATDDPPLSSLEYQKELADFDKSLRAQGIQASARMFAFDALHGAGGLLGEFIILSQTFGPLVGGVIWAWLHAKYGRKVRLKVGEIEAEAQTVAEVETLLNRAEEFQQRNKPKVLHDL